MRVYSDCDSNRHGHNKVRAKQKGVPETGNDACGISATPDRIPSEMLRQTVQSGHRTRAGNGKRKPKDLISGARTKRDGEEHHKKRERRVQLVTEILEISPPETHKWEGGQQGGRHSSSNEPAKRQDRPSARFATYPAIKRFEHAADRLIS